MFSPSGYSEEHGVEVGGLAGAGTETDTSSGGAPSISLPKGGGAIRNIGEKFNVSPATGTGSFEIKLPISNSRGKARPDVSLEYDSGNGNGPFGLGWALSVKSITRKTDKGLPKYRKADNGEEFDVFMLGDEDLVPMFKHGEDGGLSLDRFGNRIVDEVIRDDFSVRIYRPRVETLFERIEHWTPLDGSGHTHWRTISKDNTTTMYGNTEKTRLCQPGATNKIFSWLLAEVHDIEGNCMVFHYKQENSQQVPLKLHESTRNSQTRSANRYLKRIQYGNRTPSRDSATWAVLTPFGLPDSQWMFSLILDYGEHDTSIPTSTEIHEWAYRQDPFSTNRPGFELRTYRLCRRVLMFHHFPSLSLPEQLVWSIELGYNENAFMSLMTSATHVGYSYNKDTNLYRTQRLPPAEFEYSSIPDEGELLHLPVQELDTNSILDWPGISDQETCQLIDLHGEGLPGMLAEIGSEWFYKPNLSSVGKDNKITPKFGPAEPIALHPGAKIKQGHIQLVSLTANGSLDALNTRQGMWGFYSRRADGEWDSYRYMNAFPNIDMTRPEVKLLDITGDGLADILVAEDEVFTWFESLGYEGFAPEAIVPKPFNETDGPRIVFTNPEDTIYLADMTGDGLWDIVRLRNGNICYWANMGYGRFGAKIEMENSPWFDSTNQFNNRNVLLIDIDGSGTNDVIYLGPDGIDMYLNQSGNGFTNRKRLGHFPGMDRASTVRPLDLLGTGTSCLVWSSVLPSNASLGIKYLDILGGMKPHLLTKLKNNMGAETKIIYSPSTAFYMADKLTGNHWATKIPFPVHCVKKIETIDQVSGHYFSSSYAYHEGFYDGREREFRGFGFVDHWDSEAFSDSLSVGTSATNTDPAWSVPPVHTKTWYWTGAYDYRKSYDENMVRDSFPKSSHLDLLPSSFDWQSLQQNAVFPSNIDASAIREAYRSVKGKQIRQEVYAVDNTAVSTLPYLISESCYAVQPHQAQLDDHKHGSFAVHHQETISYHCERNLADLRVSHDFDLDIDAYGNITKAVKVVYGRTPGQSSLTGAERATQESTIITYVENDFTNPVSDALNYLSPRPAETRTYQIYGIEQQTSTARYTPDKLVALANLSEVPFETKKVENLAARRLFSRKRFLYLSDDMTRILPFGETESLGLVGENYSLNLTSGLLREAYQRTRGGDSEASLLPDPANVLDNAGYIDLDRDGNWWTRSGRSFFTKDRSSGIDQELATGRSNFFQKRRFKDPFGQDVVVDYDQDFLLVVRTEDPVGNVKTVDHNYETLQPALVTDGNGNQAECKYDEFGKIACVAIKGKESDDTGDNLDHLQPSVSKDQMERFVDDPTGTIALELLGDATTRIIENNTQFWLEEDTNKKMPVFRATISREKHVRQNIEGPPRFRVEIVYYDSSGQELQKKFRSDDAGAESSWMVSGWTILNNKGKPVKKYEPFFDSTHKFTFNNQVGVCSTVFYDPLNRIIGSLNPNKTWSKVIFSPWQHTVFDENDTVLLNIKNDDHISPFVRELPTWTYSPSWYEMRMGNQLGVEAQKAAVKTALHANTPRILHLDSLNRPFSTVVDDGSAEKISTSTTLNISGNVTTVRDAEGRIAEENIYDMSGNNIRKFCMDAGTRCNVFDVSKNTLLRWDTHGRQFRSTYDNLRRLTRLTVRDGSGAEIQVQKIEYGEVMPNAQASNLRGQIAQIYDQAGKETFEYDVNGNLTSAKRQFAEDYKAVLDWQMEVKLESQVHETLNRYDALNRRTGQTLPDKSLLRLSYTQSDKISKIEFNNMRENVPEGWTTYAGDIRYNARGEREAIQYGNGAQTICNYDSDTFRLIQQQTSRNSSVLQDLNYFYDPVGNVTSIRDDTQQAAFFRNQVIESGNEYRYDASYRLIESTGREHLAQGPSMRNGPTEISVPTPGLPSDGSALSRYTEFYSFDKAGNLRTVRHAGSDAQQPGWTREYEYKEPSQIDPRVFSNRLSTTSVGENSTVYRYDLHGNMLLPHLSHMEWDYWDHLHATATQNTTNGRVPETTYYVYDSHGHRVRKVTERFAGIGQIPMKLKERIYVGAFEVYREFGADATQLQLERISHSIGYGDLSQVALLEIRTIGSEPNIPARNIKYSLGDMLHSVCLQLDEIGQVISYEEYTPYGTTSFQSARGTINKRYRFTNKESDEESGLYYHGARYYAPWIGRWCSPDPSMCHEDKWNWPPNHNPDKEKLGATLEQFSTHCSPYVYVNNRPTIATDPDGRDAFFLHFPHSETGHAGILLVDNKTGNTSYYDFYPRIETHNNGKVLDTAELIVSMAWSTVGVGAGQVNSWEDKTTAPRPHANVASNGYLYPDSIQKLLSEVHQAFRTEGPINAVHFRTDKDAQMKQAAEEFKVRAARHEPLLYGDPGYGLLFQNCTDFVLIILRQDYRIQSGATVTPFRSPWFTFHEFNFGGYGYLGYTTNGKQPKTLEKTHLKKAK